MSAPTCYEDILYEEKDGVATITLNRPAMYNAFRGKTCDELLHAFGRAGWSKAIGVIVLTGAGTKAFCTGGDQSAHEGSYDGRGTIGLPMEELHAIIRLVPKPVIAKVRGYAIGGGNVLATLCDLTVASETAQFGQVGPKMGSVDPGFGTAYLARIVGDKKAREIWYCAAAIRQGSTRNGADQQGRTRRPARPKSAPGAARSWRRAPPRSRSRSARSMPIPTALRALPPWGCRRSSSTTRKNPRKGCALGEAQTGFRKHAK